MLTQIQGRLIKIHLKTLLALFIEAVNHNEWNNINEYKNTIIQTINILIGKSDLPKEVKEKLLTLRKSVTDESADVGNKYNDLIKSL